MPKTIKEKRIDECKKISEIFATLSEKSKTMAIVYLSALHDKEMDEIRKPISIERKMGRK